MSHTTAWTVPHDHPAFAGHFPDTPILPGVVLLDVALQAICTASAIALRNCTLNSVKFLSPAQPGDVLSITHDQQENGSIHFDISTLTHKIATGSIVVNLHP